jgi:hypothetical protein
MIATGVCAAKRPTAMNCDAPANTRADMAMTANGVSPDVAATAP